MNLHMDGPVVVSLAGEETLDGLAHTALRSVVWFGSKKERENFMHNRDGAGTGPTFEGTKDGRRYYAVEMLSLYLD